MNNLEDLLEQIGNANRFQVVLVFFVKTPAIFIGWTMVEMSFVKAQPDWCCVPKHTEETPDEHCNGSNGTFSDTCLDDNVNCSFRYYDDGMNTMVNEWDLVCDAKWKVDLSISVQMAGVLVGALITGYLADFIGRKKTFYISISSLTISSLVAGFSTSWEMFMVFRVLLGVSCGIYFVVSIPYMMEFLSSSKRDLASVIPTFSLGGVLLALTAWQFRDWRWVHWLCAAISLPFLSSWFFIPESLRWLTVKGRLDEAEKVAIHVARINRKVVPKTCRQILKKVYEKELIGRTEDGKDYSYLDIYRGWQVFKISVKFQIMWFALSFCLYGIAFSASTLNLDLYLSLFILAVSSIPVLLGLQIVMTRFGRRTVALVLLSVSTLCGLASIAVYKTGSDENESKTITSILCLISNALSTAAWAAIMVLINESYPTVLRSLGYAAANTVARLGGILAPFAFDFDKMPLVAFGLISGFMALCTLLLFSLDETRGQILYDTLAEAKFTRDNVEENIDRLSQKSNAPLLSTNTKLQRKDYGVDGQTTDFIGKEANSNDISHDDS